LSRTTLALISTVVSLSALDAQSRGPTQSSNQIDFGRAAQLGTKFTGRADGRKTVGEVDTYTGNVTIKFPDSKVILRADKVTFDGERAVLTPSGHVRLDLDAQNLDGQ
jgi:lipopolysaccharide assembly outer membrane protein LptD (OstA)